MPAKLMNEPQTAPEVERVLRHKTSKEYFKDGVWTADLKEASRFEDVIQVAQTCTRYGLKDVELTLHSRNGCEVFSTSIR